MFRKIQFIVAALIAAAMLLAGCKPKDDSDRTGLRLPQSPLLSVFERKSGLIAYVGVDGNVYVVDQSGQKPTQVTGDARLKQNDFRYYEFPTWSPDGSRIAFYGLSGTSQTDVEASVYTVGSEGKNLIMAYTSSTNLPIYLSWSPDSKSISFVANIQGGNSYVLNMVPAEGGETQTLDVGNPYYWDWLPDSSGVLVHTGGASYLNPSARLAFLSLNDGVIEEGLSLKPALFQSPAFSPDGSKVLLGVETDDGKNALLLTDHIGNVQSLVATFEASVAFGWSPDGKRIAYIESDTARTVTTGKLNVVELGEEKNKASMLAETDVVAFYWSPDSKQLVYFVPVQVAVTPEAGAQTGSGQDVQIYLKTYVADVAKGSSTLIATFAPTQDFLRTIPFFDQYSRSATIWSPDSQNLVLSAYGSDGTPGIFVVPASGVTAPRFLQEGTMAFWSWN